MIEFFGSLFENSETVLLFAAFVIYFAAALVRRFDRAIYVELPDRGERELYLKRRSLPIRPSASATRRSPRSPSAPWV